MPPIRSRLALWTLLCLAFAHVARAEPPPKERIPDVLEPWIPWVLEDLGDEACPLVNEVRTCVWASALDLSVNASGGTFTMRVTADQKREVILPGSVEHWPEEVKVDNKLAPVEEPSGLPQVLLERGAHVISGRFSWKEIPDSLASAPNLGTLTLSVDGKRMPFPKREASGLIWLLSGGGKEEETDTLELSVQRKLSDGVPMLINTRIHVSASGKAREIMLPHVLVPGTRAIQLDTDLPAQLERDGTLRLQAQGGDYCVEITSVRETPADALQAPQGAAPWPDHETWVWVADDRLRHAELGGAPQIDPSRTDLDKDWLSLPTYVVNAGTSLAITTRRRGEPEPPPNQLNLSRSLWLDLDGDGYTVKDELNGALTRGFRMDLTGGELGHAVVDGVDQLITRHDGKAGVELRRAALALTTEWRLEHGRADLPAVGYSEDVQSLRTSLRLPPGYLLLGAQGVDHLPGTWLDDWDLFDFFFVLILSLAVAKLSGRAFGVLALATLVLTHHESEAPALAWIFLLVTTAVLRVIKARAKFEKVALAAWLLSLLCFLFVAIPFAVDQVRTALYPHLRGAYVPPEGYQTLSQMAPAADMEGGAPATAAPAAPPPEAKPEEMGSEESARIGSISQSLTKSRPRRAKDSGDGYGYGGLGLSDRGGVYSRNEVDPNSVVQTGPGVPTWNASTFELSWSGPVEKSQKITLFIVPPVFTRLWSLLNVLLSAGLLAVMLMAARKKVAGLSDPPPPMAATALLLLGFIALPSIGRAQEIPPDELLQALRARMTSPARCEPACISVEKLDLAIDGSRLTLRASVHASAIAAYQAPGPLDSWAPDQLRVDGKDALAVTRLDDGFLHVRLDPGLHTVELSGPIPATQALTLALGQAPHRVTARAQGWVVEGLREDGRAEGSLVLRREVEVSETGERAAQSLAQWLDIKRELDLGVKFRVRTTITRLGPASESVLVRLPLLPGESILDSGITSDGKTALIELKRDESSTTVSSTLGVTRRIDLRAALPNETKQGNVEHPWNETWVVRCSALYSCSFDGLAPISRHGDDGMLAFSYRPWPGEALSIQAERLEAEKGTSVTIDAVELALTPGTRMEQSTLTLHVRTSRGTTEHLQLPEKSTLTSLTVDGNARPARLNKGALEITLDPGQHELKIALQAPRGMAFAYASEGFGAKRPLVNVTSIVNIPQDRWLLWARGPSWGPAILFWGYLIIVLLGAAGLSRVPHSPLSPRAWILLGLGLTQIELPVLFIIVGWLFLLSFRERTQLEKPIAFNAFQLLLAFATVVALGCLAYAVHRGLVVQPDMQVQGMNSTNTSLRWFVDRTGGELPTVGVFSLPLWIYKALMLIWALWLAASLLRWLRWGFNAFRDGGAWKALPPREPKPENPRVPIEQIQAAQAALAEQKPKEG